MRWWVLDYFPAGLFGSVMGLTGLSVAWRLAHDGYQVPIWPSTTIAFLAIVDFVFVSAAYLLKLVVIPRSVIAELNHPVTGSLAGTVFVSMLLLPIVIAPWSLPFARGVWWVGAVGMVAFAFLTMSRWLGDRQQIVHATPAWVIPVVGLLDLPLAMQPLRLTDFRELAVFGFATGLFFTTPIFTLIFTRLLFEEAMPVATQPTLLILDAPFTVGYTAYKAVGGANDLFAHSLFLLGMFLLVVLLIELRKTPRAPFRMTWWATSFPLAAAAIAALGFSIANPSMLANIGAWVLLGFATFSILLMFILTLIVLIRGRLRLASSSWP
jgi:tellurite resistance protein